ncbi:MAG: hypothetical protein QNK31_10205, partial [Porticoccus sp.]|nr:hypothetical protein [Porticoccus sp.]
RSIGGTVTKEGEKITAIVTLPDGSKDTVELYDNGRDAGGHGDDMAGDGIFTGVYTSTAQKGAYGFHFKVNVDQWQPGEEGHNRDVNQKSPRFMREVRISAGVSDPNDIVTEPEDEHKITPTDDDQDKDIQRIKWLVIIILIILFVVLLLILRCCCSRKMTLMSKE